MLQNGFTIYYVSNWLAVASHARVNGVFYLATKFCSRTKDTWSLKCGVLYITALQLHTLSDWDLLPEDAAVLVSSSLLYGIAILSVSTFCAHTANTSHVIRCKLLPLHTLPTSIKSLFTHFTFTLQALHFVHCYIEYRRHRGVTAYHTITHGPPSANGSRVFVMPPN